MSVKKAYFAGGCFWCITPVFEIQPGVGSVVSGYSGGDEADPDYEAVKSQLTGHRETVCVEYDDTEISYGRLLEVFLSGVDPFDGGGQFIDRGRSYTLAVYFNGEDEKNAALERIEELERRSGEKVYISVEPFKSFYPAEEYHQDYYLKQPEAFERELVSSGRKAAAGGESSQF